MSTRQQLHELVDRLPEAETAPPDDEPYTDEQQRRDAEARAAHTRGESISHEDVLREFGL